MSARSTDTIQSLLSTLSLGISLILSYREYQRTRFAIDFSILDYKMVRIRCRNIIQLFVSFQNQSNQPLAISSVCIKDGSPFTQCELIPKKIRGEKEQLITTPMFPLNLAPYQGFSCYLEFVDSQDILLAQGKTVALRIHTNRGPKDISLSLPKMGRYLHTV